MRINKGERGNASIETVGILLVLPTIMAVMALCLNIFVTQVQLINAARLGTDLVVHMNANETGTSVGNNREVWRAVRDFLCSDNKGNIAGAGTPPIKGRQLGQVTGGVASRNDFLNDVNVWAESPRWGNGVPGNPANAMPRGALYQGTNVTYFEPTEPNAIEPFYIVVRYRIKVSGFIKSLIGQDYVQVMGRSFVLNDTGMASSSTSGPSKNVSKS